MKKPSKRELDRIDAESYRQLIEELKVKYPKMKDIYYSDHWDGWIIRYSDPELDTMEELEDFAEVISELDKTHHQTQQ